LATPDTAYVEFSVPADVLSADGPFVVKDVPVLFRAGKYPFPEEDGGPFEMTADDIRAALEKVPPEGVPITNEHNKRCWFKGKLGRFIPAAPAGDYSQFGGKAEFPLPVVQLSGAGPYGLSANFRRADKTLQDVSLTWSPRIQGAAAFAAFAAFAKSEGSAMETTPHGRAAMQQLHDDAARFGALCKGAEAKKKFGNKQDDADAGMAAFTSQHERDAMQSVHDTMTGMGATCDVSSDSSARKKGDAAMAAYTAEFGPPPSPREKELEARLARIEEERAAERAAAKAAEEARFSATVASFAAQAETFADSLRDRLHVWQRPLCLADYCQSAEDDLRHPGAEVHFSTVEGKPWKGTRLEACKARWQSLPPHGLTSEGIKARAGAEALFAANDSDPKPMSAERRQNLLAHTPIGQAVLRERRAAGNGK
jgi:hypothetical protein